MPALETNFELLQQIFDHFPESAVWTIPVWNTEGNQIVDFQFRYCNPASNALAERALSDKYILADKLPDPAASQLIFEQNLQVYHTGEPLEYSYFSTSLDKYLTLKRVKIMDGVLTTLRNRTEEYTAQIAKEKQSKLLHSLIETSPYGIGLYSAIRNETGQITDFKLTLCNKKSAEFTGFSVEQLYTHTVKELMAIRGQSAYFDICSKVVETGESTYMEYYSPSRKQWLGFSIVKFEDGYLLNYIDITQTKQYEQEAKAHAHDLDAIFNGSISGMYTAQVLRNTEGRVYDFIFLRANASFYSMFHASPEKIIGQSLLTISGTDDQSQFIQYTHDVLESGQPAVKVLEYTNPRRWFEFSIVKLNPDTVAITVNDITAQKEASFEIEQQRNLLDTIMRQSPNGLSVTQAIRDEKGLMVDARSILLNDACERLNGVPNAVLLSHTMGELSPELLASPLFSAAAQLQTGETFRTEYFLPQTQRWLELAIAKMDADHFINVFTDISAVKEVQEALERTVSELQRSNASLEEFAYAASHDLKEPVRKIQFFTERIKNQYTDILDEGGHKLFERLELAAERMRLLIDDLLEYSQTNQGAGVIEDVNLQDKVQKVLEDLELVIQEKEALVTIEALPVVKGNPRQLQQLFQNLISNALKYHKKGQRPEVSITVRTISGGALDRELPPEQKEKVFHSIAIRDNGIGFDKQDSERIFQVFTRLHGNTEYKGTGVGLSIVRKVVENHQGYVLAQSEIGKGATFTILLPVA